MCVFLQNQNFKQQSENLIQQLFESTYRATEKMHLIQEQLTDQMSGLQGLKDKLISVDKQQKILEEGMQQGVEEIRKLHNSSKELEIKVNQSLEIEVRLLAHGCNSCCLQFNLKFPESIYVFTFNYCVYLTIEI